MITRPNNVWVSGGRALGEDTDTGTEERRTGFVADGDEETKVKERKTDFVRKKFKVLFRKTVRKTVFVLGVVFRGRWEGERSKSVARERRDKVHTRSLIRLPLSPPEISRPLKHHFTPSCPR